MELNPGNDLLYPCQKRARVTIELVTARAGQINVPGKWRQFCLGLNVFTILDSARSHEEAVIY